MFTSGTDRSFYPAGVLVGKVTGRPRSADGTALDVTVAPSADLTSITYVKVVLREPAGVIQARVAACILVALVLQVCLFARSADRRGRGPTSRCCWASPPASWPAPTRGPRSGFAAGLRLRPAPADRRSASRLSSTR